MKTKFAFLVLYMFFLCFFGYGQSVRELSSALARSRADTNRVHLLLALGDYYKPRPENNFDISSSKIAIGYYDRARELSSVLNNAALLNISSLSIGDCYIITNSYAIGKRFYLEVIENYHKRGDLDQEAAAWSNLALHTPLNDSLQAKEKYQMFKRAFSIYMGLKNQLAAIRQLQNIGEAHLFEGKLDLAEGELLNALDRFNKIGYKPLYPVYDDLSRLYKTKGNLSRQLFYLLELIRNFEVYGSKPDKAYYYFIMGGFYKDWGSYDKALAWCLKSADSAERYDKTFYSEAARQVNNVLLLKKTPQAALVFLENAVKRHPTVNPSDQLYFNESFGDCFTALGKLKKAGPYYLMALADYQAVNMSKAAYSVYEDVWINQKLGDYYFNIRDFQKSAFYFAKLKSIPVNQVKPIVLSSLYLSMFRTDSALGNYLPSIRHYQLYKKISDSLFNISRSGQIAEMQTKYETSQKEQTISLLKSEGKSQHAELKSLNLERNITIAGLAMLVLTGGMAYRGYRNKQSSNLQLQAKQSEINRQNFSLQLLLGEKDSLLSEKDTLLNEKDWLLKEKDWLLKEKDWLLKEVHHRVKNNLQIVISLLNTQSAFLENVDARSALRESQNRVQSISLIHQKLYNSRNPARINMKSYISDLLFYLADCYGTDQRKIRVEQIVEDITIDISQAVPLGLILNEAITNAIKYAFGPAGGEIGIGFQRIGQDTLTLSIIDNGVGVSDEVIKGTKTSLGMKMMRILSKQLGGTITIKNTSGLMVSLEFPEEKLILGV